MSLSHRLWQDRTIFRQRAEKQAAALVAVFRALEKHRPLNGGEAEVLELHRFLLKLDEDIVADVLGDPYARLWTRLAFALCAGALRNEPVPPEAKILAEELGSQDVHTLLRAHLEQYKRLVLAAALRAGAALDLVAPLEVELPFAIPAAGIALAGRGMARIFGVEDGTLRFEGGDVNLEICPRTRIDDWSVPLQPSGWLVPGIGRTPLAAHTSHAFQEDHRMLVDSAIALIARHQPDVFAQMREVIRWLAVNPISETSQLNYMSHSELPGTFVFQGIRNPYSGAEACIHEFHHNRLFCLEECEPILLGDALGTEDNAAYYSPWREGLRPMRGILHGVYVSLAQFRFWVAVAQATDTAGILADFVAGQLIRQPLTVAIGLGQLERHGRLTAAGASFVAQLRRDLDELLEQTRSLEAPWDVLKLTFGPDGSIVPFRDETGTTMSMRESIALHIRLYDEHRQVPADWIAANLSVTLSERPRRMAMGGA